MCLINFYKSYLFTSFFILSLSKISTTLITDQSPLSQNEPCHFVLNNGQTIDLSPLVSSNEPMTVSTTTSLYIYHPCKDVKLETKQPNVCQASYGLCYFVPLNHTKNPVDFKQVLSNETYGNFTLLAYNSEAVFRENQRNEPEIVYKHLISTNGSVITTLIKLECSEKIETYHIAIDQTSVSYHELTLSSKYNCVNPEHYMSGGTVFLITLIVFGLIYFVGGILVLKFIRGANGVEMIPNHEFWCKLPQLAKDGFAYLASCGKSKPDSYEKI